MGASKVKAYLLITIQGTDLDGVLERLAALPNVISAESITAPYDIVCVAEADGLAELGKTVSDKVAAVEGVRKCVSCIVN